MKAMFKRIFQSLVIISLVTAPAWAAADSFVGDWKPDASKSKLIDQMKIRSLDGNKYEFDFGGVPERIVVDGTFQPGIFGTALSVTNEGPGRWKVVRKKAGRMMVTGTWKLSKDGDSLSDNYTEFAPNESSSTTTYLYRRMSAGRGFAGTWESSFPINSAVIHIRPL